MSDYLVKIIPKNPVYSLPPKQADNIIHVLKTHCQAEQITVSFYEFPTFIDCGSNLQKINCPHCGMEISFDWWNKVMTSASQQHFQNLSIITPCCERESTLNALEYDFPCGFARLEFAMLNPVAKIGTKLRFAVEEMLGTPIRIIHAHY